MLEGCRVGGLGPNVLELFGLRQFRAHFGSPRGYCALAGPSCGLEMPIRVERKLKAMKASGFGPGWSNPLPLILNLPTP